MILNALARMLPEASCATSPWGLFELLIGHLKLLHGSRRNFVTSLQHRLCFKLDLAAVEQPWQHPGTCIS